MITKVIYPCLVTLITLSILSSCKKDAASVKTTTSTTTTTLLTSSGAISLAAVATTTGTTDSIYMVNCYSPHGKKDTVAFSTLPSAIGTYLTANYSGYTFAKAYKIIDSVKVLTNYIVVIKYNGNIIGLKFTATGTFVSVLEQKDGADLGGKGWHEGGPFCNRDGKNRDTIALSAIPSAVSAYFTKTYPEDTLLHAFKTPDSTYVLISKDTVLYATNITSTGSLISRLKIPAAGEIRTTISSANLLSAITTYLTTTFPGYVVDKAFTVGSKTAIKGYVVFITDNSTNYAVEFDAKGAFVKSTVVH